MRFYFEKKKPSAKPRDTLMKLIFFSSLFTSYAKTKKAFKSLKKKRKSQRSLVRAFKKTLLVSQDLITLCMAKEILFFC